MPSREVGEKLEWSKAKRRPKPIGGAKQEPDGGAEQIGGAKQEPDGGAGQ